MIYLDNAATTKPSACALEKAAVYNSDKYFNPSTLYSDGLNCAKEIRFAKDNLLKNIGAINHELIFTSGGSESDNTAIFCSVKRGTFVTTKGEHSAVYKSFLELKNKGIQTEFVDLNADGTVNVGVLLNVVKNLKPTFVSVVHVNNETGGINDVNYIAKKIKELDKNIIFHVDGVQAYGKLPYRISSDIDFYAISAHKINGLKGVGALIKKKGVKLSPLIFGGGQEGGYRSGTENLFGIKVFEYAAQEKYSFLQENYDRINQIKDFFIKNLNMEDFTVISGAGSSPFILTVSALGLRGEVVMHALESQGVIVGNGSACSSKNRFSRIIESCGYKNEILDGVIRFSFSIETTIQEATVAVEIINKTVSRLKGILK